MQEKLQPILTWLEANPYLALGSGVMLLLLVAFLVDVVAKRILLRTIKRLTGKTRFTWDDELSNHKVFSRLAQVAPAAVIYFGVDLIPPIPENIVRTVQNVAFGFSVFMLVLATGALLTAGNAIYEKYPIARERPIKGFVQVCKIIVYVLGSILVVAAIMERSPLLFLSGFGALTAVLMLVFKDTILSLVASIQITTTEMLRVGDWVEMPQYGADGDVIDIALHTVKIQNWDKTVSSIPTHKFISDAFKNWRFMAQSGGRRLKRSLNIDLGSIKHLDQNDIDDLRQFDLLKDYLDKKAIELADKNDSLPNFLDVNAKRLTNVGTFRMYVLNYLRANENLNSDMTLMVRQLEPDTQGLPLEIYAFTRNTAWAHYENVQADIFDHLLVMLPKFGLKIFQPPSGADIALLTDQANNKG